MNCNASSFGNAARAPGRCIARAVAMIAAIFMCSIAGAESVMEFDDAAARMQYAFFTADRRALEEVLFLVQGFEPEPALEATRSYQLAYGHWKLAQLYAEAARGEHPMRNAASLGAKAAKACSEYARAATEKDARMAEVYAIQAVCESMPQGYMRLGGLGSGSCARSRLLRTALSQAPQSPRVLFVEALCAPEQNAVTDLARWQRVAEAFANSPSARPGAPDWGHAETLTLLAEHYLHRKDFVAARDAAERALVLAPDYHAAQMLLEAIASQRSN